MANAIRSVFQVILCTSVGLLSTHHRPAAAVMRSTSNRNENDSWKCTTKNVEVKHNLLSRWRASCNIFGLGKFIRKHLMVVGRVRWKQFHRMSGLVQNCLWTFHNSFGGARREDGNFIAGNSWCISLCRKLEGREKLISEQSKKF